MNPDVVHTKWKPEEDERLIRAVQTHGRIWSKICEEEFPKRSATDLKNRYVILIIDIDGKSDSCAIRHALIQRRQQSQRSLMGRQIHNRNLSEGMDLDFEEDSSDEDFGPNTWSKCPWPL